MAAYVSTGQTSTDWGFANIGKAFRKTSPLTTGTCHHVLLLLRTVCAYSPVLPTSIISKETGSSAATEGQSLGRLPPPHPSSSSRCTH